jgi:hypothetical protein
MEPLQRARWLTAVCMAVFVGSFLLGLYWWLVTN